MQHTIHQWGFRAFLFENPSITQNTLITKESLYKLNIITIL
jgi:hypothetical protein